MNLNTILKIPKVFISQQQNKKDNEMIQFNNKNNIYLNKEEKSSNYYSKINNEINYINNKIKIQEEKLIKIESSLETLINIIKNKPEIDKRSKSTNIKNSSYSLDTNEKKDKKNYKRKNIRNLLKPMQ